MIIGTTPTHTFKLKNVDTSLIKKARVLYSQDDVLILTKEDCTIEDNTIKVRLTQDDTFKFDHNKNVVIQLRILTTGNDALATVPHKVGVIECLENEVLI